MANLIDMKAKLGIVASVTGGELIDKFGVKLNTVGKTADTVNKQMAGLGNGLKALAAGFGGFKLAELVGEFARVTIQLEAYQKQLSIGFGAGSTMELEKLRDTMRQLGISQDEALGSAVRFTSALKLSGQNSAEANKNFEAASKLILSNKLSADGAQRVYYAMAQIASKGKLMSEELNGQLGENLAGIMAQTAKAMGKSNAQLMKDMQDGKVTAEDFFVALQKIGDGIDPSQLESSAQSLGKLKNAWFDFKTSILNSFQIKKTLDLATAAIQYMTDHGRQLLSVAKDLAYAFAAWSAVKYLQPLFTALGTAIWAVSFSIRTYGVATTLAVNGSLALRAAMTGLGGAIGVMGGVLSIALVGLGYLAAKHMESKLAAEELSASIAEQKKQFSALHAEQSKTAIQSGQMSDSQRQMITSTAALTGEVGLLSQAWARVAAEAKNAAIAQAIATAQKAQANYREADQNYKAKIGDTTVGRAGNTIAKALGFGALAQHGQQQMVNNAGAEFELRRQAARNWQDATRDLQRIQGMKLEEFKSTPQEPLTKTKKKRKAKGPTEAQIIKSYEDMLNGITQEDIKARRAFVNDAQAAYDSEIEAINSEIAEKKASLNANKNLTLGQRLQVTVAINQLELDKKALAEAKMQDAKQKELDSLTEADINGKLEMLQLQDSLATTAKDRRAAQLAILDLEEQLEKIKLDEVINAKQGVTDAQRQAAQKRRDQIDAEHDQKVKKITRDTATPLEAFAEQLRQNTEDMNASLESVAAKGLQSLEDGLISVMDGTKSVAAAFSDMARSIIADLIKIAVEEAIMKPITTFFKGLFANGGAFENGVPKFANGGAFSGGVQYFATGGVVSRPTAFGMAGGRMGVMGEAGPEAIMPLRRLGNGRLGVEAHGAGVQNNVSVTVNSDGGGQQVTSNGDNGAQLGRAISAAVVKELINQRRPGGLLAA